MTKKPSKAQLLADLEPPGRHAIQWFHRSWKVKLESIGNSNIYSDSLVRSCERDGSIEMVLSAMVITDAGRAALKEAECQTK